MDGLKQAVKRRALEIAEYVTPVLRSSRFRETGVITPDEFVAAGDFLVHHCPTWQWATGDKPPKNYLPAGKQYLLTRNVPCYKRIKQMDNHDEDFEKVVENDGGDGWVDTHHFASQYADESEKPSDLVMGSSDPLISSAGATTVPHDSSLLRGIANMEIGGTTDNRNDDDDDDDEDEAADMEEFFQHGMLDELDPVAVISKSSKSNNIKNGASRNVYRTPHEVGACNNDNVIQTRTYDLYITYDKYYQTPRMWLYGYDEHRRPLSEDQMYEDFSQDHVKRTVTMEQHPHLSGPPMPSIHPCKQAEVMRKLIELVADSGGGSQLDVHQYLMIFLKFVQAVIPTIEYDYTRNFDMS